MKKIILVIVVILCVIIAIFLIPREAQSDTPQSYNGEDVGPWYSDNLIVKEIQEQSQAYGVDFGEAYEIAKCESNFDRYSTNPVSGAKGVYQFLDSTWEFINAPGHQYDYKENIRQFMIWYGKYPNWWRECLSKK